MWKQGSIEWAWKLKQSKDVQWHVSHHLGDSWFAGKRWPGYVAPIDPAMVVFALMTEALALRCRNCYCCARVSGSGNDRRNSGSTTQLQPPLSRANRQRSRLTESWITGPGKRA